MTTATKHDEAVERVQASQLHLAAVVLWAGLMLLVLAGWLSFDHEELQAKAKVLAVCGGLLAVLGFVAGLRMAQGTRLAAWYCVGAFSLLAGAAYAWWDRQPLPYALVPAGLGLLCLALAGLRASRPVTDVSADYIAGARAQRGRLAGALIVVGLALIGVAGYLAYTTGLSGLGESLGAGLLGLTLAATGFFSLSASDASDIGALAKWRRPIGLALCVLGVFGFVGALLLAFRLDSPTVNMRPEGVSLGGASILLFGLGLLLLVESRLETLRTLLPAGGILFGLLLILGAVIWIGSQRDRVLQGGMSSWTGEQSWIIWLAAYQVLVGLICPFAALMLVGGDLKEEPALRRSLFRTQAVVTIVFAALALIVANAFFFTFVGQTYSWSKGRGLYTISDATKRLVGGLKEPTTVYVFVSNEDSIVFPQVKTLLTNFEAESNLLTTRYLDTIRNAEFQILRQRFKEIPRDPDGLLIVYGEDKGDLKEIPKHAFIPINKMIVQETNKDKERHVSFRGEQELLRELKYLALDSKKRPLYFLQGHGELDILKPDRINRRSFAEPLAPVGAEVLTNKLGSDKFDVKGLSFEERPEKASDKIVYLKEPNSAKPKEIPEDCDVLIVLGPSQPLAISTLESIDAYLQRGGRMFVAFDVVADKKFEALKFTGLENLVAKYGVKVGGDFVLRVTPPSPFEFTAITTNDAKTTLGQRLAGNTYEIILSARVVGGAKEKGKYQVDPVLDAPPLVIENKQQLVIAENVVASLQDPLRHLRALQFAGEINKRLKASEALSVGVTVSEPREGEKTPRPRMVVLGDAEMFSNLLLSSPYGDDHYNLFVNAMDWLSERQDVGGTLPRDLGIYTIRPTAPLDRAIGVPMWLMLLFIVGLGTSLWLVRRR